MSDETTGGATAEQRAELNALHQEFCDAIFATYIAKFREKAPQDAASTGRVCGAAMGAMLTVAARVAVDLDVRGARFCGASAESYERAEKNAQKWG